MTPGSVPAVMRSRLLLEGTVYCVCEDDALLAGQASSEGRYVRLTESIKGRRERVPGDTKEQGCRKML